MIGGDGVEHTRNRSRRRRRRLARGLVVHPRGPGRSAGGPDGVAFVVAAAFHRLRRGVRLHRATEARKPVPRSLRRGRPRVRVRVRVRARARARALVGRVRDGRGAVRLRIRPRALRERRVTLSTAASRDVRVPTKLADGRGRAFDDLPRACVGEAIGQSNGLPVKR
eukprot:31088-Pelagococcus_subviridis.AAC.3